MSDIVIRVENLGKRYRIGERERYLALRDVLARAVSAPARLFRPRKPPSANSDPSRIWALKDVSFGVRQGEVVGIIGRNGAGKTTLLKILARVTRPTEGRARAKGRVGSLLEVGTGFHPELTGRENVYLNGAILGMSKKEIDRRFDEIVAFTGVERFLETPVKYYSSGMYVRLAFAVAAHLTTEILLVDEVLAVGDAEFQRKCLAKMQQVAVGGRTILFVSHNMSAIRQICGRAIALDAGRVVDDGEPNEVADAYLARSAPVDDLKRTFETQSFILERISVKSLTGPVVRAFDNVEILVQVRPKVDVADPGLYLGILTSDGTRIAGLDLKDFATLDPIARDQSVHMGFVIEALPLLPGRYSLDVHLKDMSTERIEPLREHPHFEVIESPVYKGRHLDRWFGTVGLRARVVDSRFNAEAV
jgi:lipopolysaccharide transport system ATP-binding protein